jgi:hypothetical protein
MASSPIASQPYQKRFLAALQDGSRLETSSERWNRERRQSLESLQAAANQLVAAAAKAQHAANGIVKAFKQAQLDPERAAQIKDLATRLKAIRDRNHA